MSDPFPVFRYHSNPLKTGSIVASAKVCRRCRRRRGYIYVGPVYAKAALNEAFCPWCIADGSAAAAFDAKFTDPAGIGSYAAWHPVPPEVVEEIVRRTPGFNGWQQERWWTHCGDAAEFLGRAGRHELETEWSGAVPTLMLDAGLDSAGWPSFGANLDADGSPTAYVFRCRCCGQLGGYTDCD